jgi:hypothetical protein
VTYDEALTWAIEHNAVMRYYEQGGVRMLRVTVENPDSTEERVTMREPLPEGIEAQKAMIAVTITDMAGEFEHADRRKAFRVVV